MKTGVSAIIKADNGSKYFLILHRIKHWTGWEFLKGKIEEGESLEQALIREIKEETGLVKIKIIKKFDFKREFVNKGAPHVFDVFLVESSMNYPVVVDNKEHDNFLWAEPQRIIELLYWEDEKEAFKKALKVMKDG